MLYVNNVYNSEYIRTHPVIRFPDPWSEYNTLIKKVLKKKVKETQRCRRTQAQGSGAKNKGTPARSSRTTAL